MTEEEREKMIRPILDTYEAEASRISARPGYGTTASRPLETRQALGLGSP